MRLEFLHANKLADPVAEEQASNLATSANESFRTLSSSPSDAAALAETVRIRTGESGTEAI